MKIGPKKYAVMRWHTQARNITNNLKVEVKFTLPEHSAANIVTWECHVDVYTKGRYDIISGRYI